MKPLLPTLPLVLLLAACAPETGTPAAATTPASATAPVPAATASDAPAPVTRAAVFAPLTALLATDAAAVQPGISGWLLPGTASEGHEGLMLRPFPVEMLEQRAIAPAKMAALDAGLSQIFADWQEDEEQAVDGGTGSRRGFVQGDAACVLESGPDNYAPDAGDDAEPLSYYVRVSCGTKPD